MDLTYKLLESPTEQELDLLQNWRNDPKIKCLTSVNKNQEELSQVIFRSRIIEENTNTEDTTKYLILLNGKAIGEVNYQWNFQHLIKNQGKTAWAGIMISQNSARRKGIGVKAMQFVEKQILKAGGNRVELGVWAFNKPAHQLYLKIGYKEIARIPNFTFWNGQLWDNIQMEKSLT